MFHVRWFLLITLLTSCIIVTAEEEPAKPAKQGPVGPPKHDPDDQPFRRAPMAAATRSVVIPLSSNLNVAFDAALLRTHIAWQGGPLNLYGPPYHGSSDRFICDFEGQPLWKTPQSFPWSAGSAPPSTTTTQLPGETRFKGVSSKGDQTRVMYELDFGEERVAVHELFSTQTIAGQQAVVRRFEMGPSSRDLTVLVHAEPGRLEPGDGTTIKTIRRNEDLLATGLRAQGAKLVHRDETNNYPEVLWLEKNGKGPQIECKTNHIKASEIRVYVTFPAHSSAIAAEVYSLVCTNPTQANVLQTHVKTSQVAVPDFTSVTNATPGSRSVTPVSLGAEKTFFPRLSGDKSYKIEHFPLPRTADIRVTGMDFLPNGDLVICAWAGDVYIVHNPAGDVRQATYQRFARGLIEPMGLKMIGRQMYVAQKAELTRLTDTDGNGEADLFETINSSWGFTGRYNAFAFGPETDRAGNFFIFIGGNGGFWDVPYMGWAVKFDPQGKNFEPFCSGLRVPHGFAAFGEARDIFVTENQGNWIGACKLNHLQKGNFYGFPSAMPAPKSKYEQTTNFTPPAVWFPYTLAKSASGIAVIPNDKLGPFKNQMIVADYQLSVLTRVMLEKVNGEWQGAVWPFAKGFLSGINRVAIGPTGSVFVGGGKGGHWSGAVGPQFYSLDRLTFTGKTPFEVQEVHAKPDGFELTFTQAVDAEAAAKTDSYDAAQYTYKYHGKYGSPEFDHDGKENSSTDIKVAKAEVSPDRMKVRLTLEGWRAGYVTMVRGLDVVNEAGESLRNNTFWYTLNQIPK